MGDGAHHRRKRSRSISSYSSTSVSTISTRASHSPLRRHKGESRDRMLSSERTRQDAQDLQEPGSKRRRRTSSVSSYDGKSGATGAQRDAERNTRNRRRSTSPAERGRSIDRSKAGREQGQGAPDGRSRSNTRTDTRSEISPRPSRGNDHAMRKEARNGNGIGRTNGQYHDREQPFVQNHDRGSDLPSPPRHRERSLSPYSKRVAFSRATDSRQYMQ